MNRKIKVYFKDGRIVIFLKVDGAAFTEAGTILRVFGTEETVVGEFSRESVLGYSSCPTNEAIELTTLESVYGKAMSDSGEPT